MDSYLVLRFVHILSAVVVAGTGAGIAFFMFMASRSNNPQAIAVTARNVVLADWLFTAPAVVIQFLSGWLLMDKLNWSFSSQWFLVVLALFIFIGVCWIPVLFIQYRLRDYAGPSFVTYTIASGLKTISQKITNMARNAGMPKAVHNFMSRLNSSLSAPCCTA
jgi:uncharacterized membrane protein